MLRSPAFGFPRKRTFLVGEPATTVLATHVSSIAGWSVSGGTAILRLRAGTVFLDSPATAGALTISGGCNSGGTTALDLSALTALQNLDCHGNSLTTLDVSANPALALLDCHGNSLTTLDVSALTALNVLSCQDNNLTTLDVSANTVLTGLSCQDNNLTELIGAVHAALSQIDASGNALTGLPAYLEQLYNAGITNGTLNVSGGTNEAVDSNFYADALRNDRGWTITANA